MLMLNALWIFCVVHDVVNGQHSKGGSRGVKGGSHSTQTRWSSSQNDAEPVVTRKEYSQQQAVYQTPCDRPDTPMNGRSSCKIDHEKYVCTGSCEAGFAFPDGAESIELTCSTQSGLWMPYRNFPACVGSYGGGQSSYQGYYSQSSYNHRSSDQSSYNGGYNQQGAHLGGQTALCGSPKSPMNGGKSCQMYNGEWTCIGTCNPGYEFPDGTRQVTVKCHDKDGRWTPQKDFDNCGLLCHPPCQNDGKCAVHNQCVCPPTHRGNRCQYAVSLCDFNRLSSGTVHSRCEHKPEYTECLISCPSGMNFDPPSTSMYRCTVDGLWNPPTAPRCTGNNLCEKKLPPPMNGRIHCTENTEVLLCTGTCRSGFLFPDGFSELVIQCVKRTGEWTPSPALPNCEAICSPECLHGGRCVGHNNCLCPGTHRGSRCEYPVSNCDGHDRFASVSWKCSSSDKETKCNVSCSGTSRKLQPPQPTVYACSLDGSWQPDLKPICVSDYSGIDARNERGGRHQGGGYTWTQRISRYGQDQNMGGYSYNQDGHESSGTSSGQQRTSYEISNQQQTDYEFGGQRRVGHEFGGQQAVDYDFGSHQRSGSEFGGQRQTDYEFVEQQGESQDGRRQGEFDGQRQVDYNFGGQQRDGEFRGQQQHGEYDGQQQVDYEFGGQQVIGNEFEGQQRVSNEFEGQQEDSHEFEGQQRVGHEFEGQQEEEDDFRGQTQSHQIKSVKQPAQKFERIEVENQRDPSRNFYGTGSDLSREGQGLEEFSVDLPSNEDGKMQNYHEFEDSETVIKQLEEVKADNNGASIFSNKKKASDFQGICSIWGFFHYRTFDGEVYTFPSTCWYSLASSTDGELSISVKSQCAEANSCSRLISIEHAHNRYLLSFTDGLLKNGDLVAVPMQDGNIVVEYVARYLVVRTHSGYTVWINDENSVFLVAEPYVKNQTDGMCGNYDGRLEPTFQTKSGEQTPDVFGFANSWRVQYTGEDCVDEAELKPPCTSESREKRMQSDKANLACAAFYDAVFEACGKVLNVEVYYQLCQMDCCNLHASTDCQCASLGEFVLECSRAGIDMSRGWRQPGLCPLSCENGTQYQECGPPCSRTCTDPDPVCSQQKCVDGCHCPAGTVLEGGQCISRDSCPCHHADKTYLPGETMDQDCNTCVCQGGKWECTEQICPATCAVSGPHVTTFDGTAYDLRRRCPHTLAESEGGFSVRIDYGRDCDRKDLTAGVCVHGITVHTEQGAVVKLKPSKEVTVNGQEMTSLPVSAPGIYIGQSTSTFVRARLRNDLEIFWDLGGTIRVHAPSTLFEKVRGLCGTFTGNRRDDFLTPEGDVETSADVFASKWTSDGACADVEELSEEYSSCDVHPDRRGVASEVCNVLKGHEFQECHGLVDIERYYLNCLEDVCGCDADPEACSCLSLSNYASACARRGKPLSWRQALPACGVTCPLGLVYESCAAPCAFSCDEIAQQTGHCGDTCVDGCVCPQGKTLDDREQCVAVSTCSCFHSGHLYPPEFLQRRGKEMCACSQGQWDCHLASTADLLLTPPPHVAAECDFTKHLVSTECLSECPLTCSNYRHHQPCTVAVCVPGCSCQKGYVLDSSSGACVVPQNCPCHHGGRSYEEGEQVKMDCNSCTCEGGTWACDHHSCPGLCSAWGDTHFETFDGKLFDFDGTCDYVLVKARLSDIEFFSVVVQNAPCGMGSDAVCGKSVTVSLGDSTLVLTRSHPVPKVPVASRLTVTPVGLFTLVDSDVGISVQWDHNTRIYVTAQPTWKNKLQGLCGDFNSDASDDFRGPSGGVPLVLAKDFADSWRVHPFCAAARHPDDSCEKNPERRAWSRSKCEVLSSDLFSPCHQLVEVEEYYRRCVQDACGCNAGGDCDCLCAVVSAYAQKCARGGVVVAWRSQELCPIQCESCDQYSPCLSLCPPPNCESTLDDPNSQACSREPCVEGCEPKPCKSGHVYRSPANFTCVPEELCDDKPCAVIGGRAYREGERVERHDDGDACQSCYCSKGEIQCFGVPCAYSTLQPPTPFRQPECELTGYTDWINSVDPKDNEGNDVEDLEELTESHRIPCPRDHIRKVECRASASQEPIEATGQNVSCDEDGLACKRNALSGDCLDYEMRVYCQCHEETTCPPEQHLDKCAFDCENSCQSLVQHLHDNGLCKGEKCAPGCVKTPCRAPLVARDAETCVTPDQCTCRLSTGFIVAPGQVVTNGCEKCQCLNNTLMCSTILECRATLPPESQFAPTEMEETEPYEIVTKRTTAKPKRVTTPPTKGFVMTLTTPACSFWSDWINKGKPKRGRRHGDREDTRPYVLKQTEGFCSKGVVTAIECRDAITDQDYSETEEEKLVCNRHKGFLCRNAHQPDGLCQDYKIRYYCSCEDETTPVPLFIKEQTESYIFPCADFVPLINGPVPLSDASLKASSSESPASGPDAARMGGSKKCWTAQKSDEDQFVEVDLGSIRAVYGIISKGNELNSEWVTSYQLLYSADGVSYSYYQDEDDNNKVFSANFDGTGEVKHVFRNPFEAQFVRLEPLTWERKISLQFELLGCSEALFTEDYTTVSEEINYEGEIYEPKPRRFNFPKEIRIKECTQPIGLMSGALLDSQLSTSSSFSTVSQDTPWVAASLDAHPYFQIDFMDEANITGVMTKGREDVAQWVTAFEVSYSKDGSIWSKIKDDDGSLKEFSANYDSYTMVTNEFPSMVRTRYLRILPTKWKHWISMQVEVLGCYSPMPCRDPMGVAEGTITSHQFSSSSESSDRHLVSNARLTSHSSWSPERSDKMQYLQIDLLEPSKLTGIVTKGDFGMQQWLTSFYVGYSNDSTHWKKMAGVDGKAKEFTGNVDQNSAVINLFPFPITSRYVRILPLRWHRWTSVRLEILGCFHEQACREPMGMENGLLSTAQITASSFFGASTPEGARIGSTGSWIAEKNDNFPYIQIDFLDPRNVSAIVTKGSESDDAWVTKYKVLHSHDGLDWTRVTDDLGNTVEFSGNEDSDSPVINSFPEMVQARIFRVIPLDFENKPALQLEFLGCYHPYVCQERLGMESGTIYDFQLTGSSSLSPTFSPHQARLNSDSAWIPEKNDRDPYIQIDMMVLSNVTGLMTAGREDVQEWVKTYEMAYSDDGLSWSPLEDKNGFVLENEGSVHPTTVLFPEPIFSRFLRIKPTRYEKKPSLRFEILGCPQEKVCLEPMGMDTEIFPSGHVTASSSKNEKTTPDHVGLSSDSSWSASSVAVPQFLQVNFGDPRNISGIVTKGSAVDEEWVTAFQVFHSMDEEDWVPVKNRRGEVIEFPGNVDADSPVINVLPKTLEVQYLRIIPTDWSNWISLRAEVLGCYHAYELPTTEPPHQVLDEIEPPTEPTYAMACPNPAEIESSLLEDATLQASSSTPKGPPSRVSLHTRGDGRRSGGWVPDVDDLHPALSVTLPNVKGVTSLHIQGRSDEENWVRSLRLIASKDNRTWLPVFGPDESEVIPGNEDQNSVVVHYFKRPIEAKYIKVIPETWHRWPSFRLDLKGCEIPEVEGPRELHLCPELANEPDLASNCPLYCPDGLLCDGRQCVDPVDCACVHDQKIIKVGAMMEDSSCQKCDCALGGRTVCSKKVCPPCAEFERPTIARVQGSHCACQCESCEDDHVMCPSNHECIPKRRWCDGIVDCPDDETKCIYSTTEFPIVPTEFVVPTTPKPGNATCDVMGKRIKTFDGQDIPYEICHHVIMKDISNGIFNVTLHKDCDSSRDCKDWMEVSHRKHHVKVTSDLKVEINGHSYSPSQLAKLSKKAKARNVVVEKVGDQVTVKSHGKGFTVTYDNTEHLEIEVSPSLLNRIGGLCGFYSGFPSDDQQRPDGKTAFTSREFGDSWALDGTVAQCSPVVCPHEIMSRAMEECNKLRNEPFVECAEVLQVPHFIEFCMSSTCECMLEKRGATAEECKCDSFQSFAEECEERRGQAATRNWRFIHECNSECPPGMEWNDCGPSCQLTCDTAEDGTLEQCSEKCVPGCFCPPGTVLSGERCIRPEQCADQLCQGFGDPHFETFDGLFFPFFAEGSFLIVGDDESEFTLNGLSRRCSILTKTTCLVGLEVHYRGHKVTLRKHSEAQLDGVEIPMDKLPSHAHGMVILGYPGRTFVVFIPQMNLEARYYEDNSGFAVRVPSKKYFNKTRGLCGNCNGKKDDELEGKTLSEFVCDFQTEGNHDACKESMDELPEMNHRVPECERLEHPVFESCAPLVDVDIYVDSCSFDALHSKDAESAFCKTATEYARQCCQAGLPLQGWWRLFSCPTTCPDGLEFVQCHEGCPQTCASLKNESDESTCSELKVDGCFCPDGMVLKGDECVSRATCETCDEEGHVVGDEWQVGSCKKCYCTKDLKIACTAQVCPPTPLCSTDEALSLVRAKGNHSCCDTHACIPKIKNCPTPVVPECPKFEVAKIRTRLDSCSQFECECDTAMCPAVVWPTDLEEGERAEVTGGSCCRIIQVVCERALCPSKPDCRRGLQLTETEGKCCTLYKCKPPEDICVYTKTYKIVDGMQVSLLAAEKSISLYRPGDEWEDGLCEKCKCVESNGQHAPLCVLEQCSRLQDKPENREYVLKEMKIAGKCCPDIIRTECKDEDANIYQAGEQWNDYDNPCVSFVCEETAGGEVQKTKSLMNCTQCPKTAVYFPPSKVLGQCCGVCRVTKCEEEGRLFAVGETWISEHQPCREAECVEERGEVKTIYTKKPCPALPKDCPKNQIILDENGCCEICNVTSEISCSSGPIPEEDTVGFFTYPDENRGGMCVNERPVSNVLQCSGACHSRSYYSLEDGDFKDTCKCCKVNVTVNRTIELICPDRSHIRRTFLQPETCQCSKCAPKTSPQIEKHTTKTRQWEPSSEHGQRRWEDTNLFEFGQRPVEVEREEESRPFQEVDREIQQRQDYDNLFQHGREVQQQQKDYDDLFQTFQQRRDYD